MRPKGTRLSRRHLTWLYSAFGLLYLTGLLWVLSEYGLARLEGAASAVDKAQSWLMRFHGAGVMLVLVMLGTLVPIHIKKGWKAHLGRRNGMVLIGVVLVLVVTGYTLYYASQEGLRSLAHWGHIAFGLSLPAWIAWHIAEGRKSRLRAAKRSKRHSS